MGKTKTIVSLSLLFIGFSAMLFLGQYFLQESMALSFRIHFLIFFITFISIASIFVVYGLGKKDVLGFVFLGFVVFKLFAIGYIAVFQKGFKENLLAYFVLYWLYLTLEVVVLVRLIRNQDKNHTKKVGE